MSEMYIEHNIGDLPAKLAGIPANVTRKIMRDVARVAEQEALKRYRSTTNTWNTRPRFESSTDYTATSVTVSVGTDNDIYGFVDRGTKPHVISPKRPGYPLKFRSGYTAKTAVGILGSRPGGSSGGFVRAMSVNHPGTKARGFTALVFRDVNTIIQKTTMAMLHKRIRSYLPIRVGKMRRIR